MMDSRASAEDDRPDGEADDPPRAGGEGNGLGRDGRSDDAPESDAVVERRRAAHNKIRVAIRVSALLTPGSVFMNAMAAVIAAYGLLADSPAVVIGAMIVALLLGPIMGVALAITDGDWPLLGKAGLALLAGGVVVFLVSAGIGLVHYDLPMTDEITGRARPNILDLMIALAGGAAGAYATTAPKLAAGFVGVAIATALVPPLASSAILLTRGEVPAAIGAGLLALTNIVAIQFAAAAVLWFKGFARDADLGEDVGFLLFLRRHAGSLAVLVALGLVLAGNLRTALADRAFEAAVRATLAEDLAAMRGSQLEDVAILDEARRETVVVRASVTGPRAPTPEEVAAFPGHLPARRDGRPVELHVRFVETRIVTPAGAASESAAGMLRDPPAGAP